MLTANRFFSKLERVGKIRDDNSLFFGRSLALLLVMLFVLTGARMSLFVVTDYEKGTVLGEESDSKNKESKEDGKRKNRQENIFPVVQPMAAPSLTPATLDESAVIATPLATPTQTVETAPVGSEQSTTPTPARAVERGVTTTAPSAGETVRTILHKIGIPIKTTPTPVRQPEVVSVKEEVINERQAGEILKELELTAGTGIQRQVRLRFQTTEGGVGLVAETRNGQGYPLASEESVKISDALRQGSGLSVGGGTTTELEVSRGTTKAVTSLPLLVDLDSNTLMVETSLGIKSVAILPDTAVARALEAGALMRADPEIKLIEREDGKIAYRISGGRGRRLLGLIGINSIHRIDVSAESGRVLPELTGSLGETLFDLVAPPTR